MNALIRRHPASMMVLAALVVTWLVYLPGLGGPLLLDDEPQLGVLLDAASSSMTDLVTDYAVSTSGPSGRSVAMLSFIGDTLLFGNDTWWWKHTNVLIHLLAGLLVFVFVRLCCTATNTRHGAVIGAFVATAWLLHPLNVSTVLYTVQRMTELSSLFVLAGLVCYLQGRLWQARRPLAGWLLIGAGFFICFPLAVLSKENALLFPVYCTLIEFTILRTRSESSQDRVVRWLHAALVIGYAFSAVLILLNFSGFVLESYAHRDFSPAERLLTQFRVIATYLSQIALPLPGQLGFFHDDVAVSTGLVSPVTTLISLTVLTALLATALLTVRSLPLYAFGILFYFSSHLIESTFLGLELMFEHRNHLGLVGILVAVAALVVRYMPEGRAQPATAVGAVVVLAALTSWRVLIWSSPGSLFVAAYAAHPESPRVNLVFANSSASVGDYATARQHLDKVKAGYGRFLHGLWLDCLETGVLTNERIAAIDDVDNRVIEGHATSSLDTLIAAGMEGRCLYERNALIAAIDTMFDGIPRSVNDQRQLLLSKARLVEAAGDVDGAVAVLEDAQALNPQDALPAYMTADMLVRGGRYPAAFDALAHADAIAATADVTRNQLAASIYTGFGALLEAGNATEQAARLYRQAVDRFPKRDEFYLKAIDTLLAAGRTDDARALIARMDREGVPMPADRVARYDDLVAGR